MGCGRHIRSSLVTGVASQDTCSVIGRRFHAKVVRQDCMCCSSGRGLRLHLDVSLLGPPTTSSFTPGHHDPQFVGHKEMAEEHLQRLDPASSHPEEMPRHFAVVSSSHQIALNPEPGCSHQSIAFFLPSSATISFTVPSVIIFSQPLCKGNL